jgi:hypothetical protein
MYTVKCKDERPQQQQQGSSADHARHGGRASSFFCAAVRSFDVGKGSKLMRLFPEWPNAVPGRVDFVGLSICSWAADTLRLKELTPAKLCRLRGVFDMPDVLETPEVRRSRL